MSNVTIPFSQVFKHIVVLFILALLVQGCGERQRLGRISTEATILAFGDSLTLGVGTDIRHSYPSVLSRLSGRKVVNAGISGELTEQGLARLDYVINKTRPDLMILLEGGNDIIRNHNLQQTKQNLTAMIAMAREKGVQLVLIGVPQKQIFSDVAPFYKELAEEHKLVFDGELIANLLHKRSYKSDMVHLNKTGYQKMAEAIHQLLVKNGAL
jgi:lysophospholipase L1-like esterase